MKVTRVEPSSPAFKIGIRPGDTLISIEGQPLRDGLDLAFAESRPGSRLRISDGSGVDRTVRLPVPLGGVLGLEYEKTGPKLCKNKCIFCFIHQLPRGMRKSLYVKDEDYRYSFLFGNFLTLTNLTDGDIERIRSQRLSPLYVSVHATDEDVRRRMLGANDAPELLPLMRSLARSKIQFHCQIVVCPGYNDGAVFERTVRDLWDLRDAVISVGIVPVGLTRHRRGLLKLRAVSRVEAAEIVRTVEGRQIIYRAQSGRGFVYAADELYVKAGIPVPRAPLYDGFPQKENGVGMARLWLDGCRRSPVGPRAFAGARRITVVTGTMAAPFLEEGIGSKLRRCAGVSAQVVAVGNRFFGGGVSVAGLLTGRDIISELSGQGFGDVVCIPPDSLNGDGLTLDDMTLSDIASELDCEARLGLTGRRAAPRAHGRAGAA